MKLADYLYENRIHPMHFRRMLGGFTTHRSTLNKYLVQQRVPSQPVMAEITRLTGGAVTLKDFLDRDTPPRCARFVTRPDGSRRMVLPWSPDWPGADRPRSPDPDEVDECGEAESDGLDSLSPPIERALRVLGGRAVFTPRGTVLLDGRVSDLRRVVRAANAELLKRGRPPIRYPGVEDRYE